MGSLKNNIVPKKKRKKPDTIAFISQYRNTNGFFIKDKFYNFHEFFGKADQIVLPFLAQYAKKNSKNIFIVPSYGQDRANALKKEQEYYAKLLGQDCVFSEWRWYGSSYDAVDSAEVVVAIDSTMGYESAARCNKTAIFSIKSNILNLLNPPSLSYGWPGSYPDEGPFWTNLLDPVIFERILDYLFSINSEQWKETLLKHRFYEIMTYDPDNSILQSVIRNELGEHRI